MSTAASTAAGKSKGGSSSSSTKAPKTVEYTVGPGVGPVDAKFDALRFLPPREQSESSGEACIAKAYMMPGKAALRVKLIGCQVTGIRESRKNAPTVLARASKATIALLMSLDEHVLSIVKTNVDAWFLHRMHADLVEEYYRGNTATHIKHGVLGRFVLDGERTAVVTDGAIVDLHMQFVGIQFRRQYFTPVWKVLSAEPSDAKATPTSFEDAEDGEEYDDDLGPMIEECAEMRQALMAHLLRQEREHEDRLDKLREMIVALSASGLGDLNTLEDIQRRLAEDDDAPMP